MFCVALTGSIASGKSTAARIFRSLGIETIDADEIARALTEPGTLAFIEIKQRFGESVVDTNGRLNRRLIREQIFKDPNARQWIEQCLHPKIKREIEAQIQNVKSPYCLIEIPLLYDRKDYPYLNRILNIQSSPSQQIERCMQRDYSTHEEALKILLSQPDPTLQVNLADDLIYNTGSLSSLKKQIKTFHKLYLKGQSSMINSSK